MCRGPTQPVERQAIASPLTERQQRERDYHREFAAQHAAIAHSPLNMDVVESTNRKWWSSYWKAYEFLLKLDLPGKRVFVPGCGFGANALRLAILGAEVHASDISPDLIDICKERAERTGAKLSFSVMPAENTNHPDSFFDVALYVGVWHHIDILAGLTELRRIMKSGGTLIAQEVYSHSAAQRIRDSRAVTHVLHPAMRSFVYGSSAYLTEDERKLNQRDLELIRGAMKESTVEYFNMASDRLFPTTMTRLCRADRTVLTAIGPLRRLVAGRVVIAGRM